MATNTTNYNFVKQEENEFYDINIVNQNLDGIDDVLSQYEFQTPTISGTQIRLTKQSNANRLFFKLESELSGNITVSIDGGATSKNLVDVEGVQVTSLDKGFHEIVATANFFIIRNKGGLSKADLEALITIVNEAEANESVLRTNYINTVNTTNENINLPSTATWNDILLQIPNIKANSKRFKTGTVTPEVDTRRFIFANGTQDSTLRTYLNIRDIGFDPSLIIVLGQNIAQTIIFSREGVFLNVQSNANYLWFHNYTSSPNTSTTGVSYRLDGERAYVNAQEAIIPKYVASENIYTYFAFE